jgi:NADH:ubiquinone oxidoreductase subunit
MDRSAAWVYMESMDTVTRIFTLLHGRLVGTDATGNRYYTERKARVGARTKRWVVYKGEPDGSKVPPEWHAWLHYTVDAPLAETGRKPWQKPHEANKTGSAERYQPVATRSGGADYEAWTPGT